jgi:hypothetical protein
MKGSKDKDLIKRILEQRRDKKVEKDEKDQRI